MKKKYAILIIICLLLTASVFLLHGIIPPEVPLFYGNIQGQDQLVNSYLLIVAPISAALISVINFLISKKVHDELYKNALFAASLLVVIMTTITFMKIIFLVGYF